MRLRVVLVLFVIVCCCHGSAPTDAPFSSASPHFECHYGFPFGPRSSTYIEYNGLIGSVAVTVQTWENQDPKSAVTSDTQQHLTSISRTTELNAQLHSLDFFSLLPSYEEPYRASGVDGTAISFTFYNEEASRSVTVDTVDLNQVPAPLQQLYSACLEKNF